MGEEPDGDANLLEDESDSQSEPSEEVDEPTAESTPKSDASDLDSSDADESDPSGSKEPSASPPETTAEDGGTPSSTEPPVVEPDSSEEDDEEVDADTDADDEEGDEEEGDEGEGDDSDSDSENRQVVERPDVSLDPDQLDPDETPAESEGRDRNLKPREPDPERRKPPAEGPNGPSEPPTEPPERPEPHQPPAESEGTEGESAAQTEEPTGERSSPLAGEVATGKVSSPATEDVATGSKGVGAPDSYKEDAERSEPLEDEEMPLADHIEEMLKRLAVVVVIAGVVSLAVLPLSETVINFLWNSVLPAGETTRPRIYGPLGLVFTKLKVASLAGLVIALPVFVYETYLFMRPGLYPHERRYYLAAVPTSLVLAFVGISFAYFLILPVIFEYFLYYSEDVTTIAFALTKTFNLILLLMGYLAIVFQIPLFIMLAIMMGLTTRRWLVQRRLYFWGAFLGISFLFSPDPTGMAPIMVATTMVVLFEGTLFLLKWTGR